MMLMLAFIVRFLLFLFNIKLKNFDVYWISLLQHVRYMHMWLSMALAQYWVLSSILRWAQSESSGSDLMSLWIHWSVSIISCETMLFCLSSESLLTLYCGSLSASLCMVSLCFPCSVHGSGLSFGQECLLAGLLRNCSIALFIISWNSLMNSSWSTLWLTSDKLSSFLVSSWSLVWSWDGSYATSCCPTFPVWFLNSPVTSCLSSYRCHRTCSHVFGRVSSTCCSTCSHVFGGFPSTHPPSVTVPVMLQTLCAPGVSPVGSLLSLHCCLMQLLPQ